VISSGIHQWSADEPEELPSLLFRFKALAGDEWTSSSPRTARRRARSGSTHVGQYVLQRSPTGAHLMARHIQGFGTVGADAMVSFGTDRAARLAGGLASRPTGAARSSRRRSLDRIKRQVGSIEVAGAPIPVAQLISSSRASR
jgi:hypothetical protein